MCLVCDAVGRGIWMEYSLTVDGLLRGIFYARPESVGRPEHQHSGRFFTIYASQRSTIPGILDP